MDKIILDSKMMTEASGAQDYLKEMMGFPDYYGKNLDALYDCLTETEGLNVEIRVSETSEYLDKIIRVFQRAQKEEAVNLKILMSEDKKAVGLSDFLQYKYLSALKYAPGGKSAAFIVSCSSDDKKRYESRLWLYDGTLHQLTDMGKENSFIWEDDSHILFPAVRSESEKKRREEKEMFTSYYRLDIHGGEAVHAFDVPFTAETIEKTKWGYMIQGSIDAEYADYYRMSSEERRQTEKYYEEEADYEVLDELPFWFNGTGMINKKRSALFVMDDKGNIRRITDPCFDTGSKVCIGSSIVYTGDVIEGVRPVKSGKIYRYDMESGSTTILAEMPGFSAGGLTTDGKSVWFSATDCSRYGLNENSWVYTLDIHTGNIELIRKEEYNMYGSVGSDSRYGGGSQWQVKGDALYYIGTREGNAVINRLTKDGMVHPVLEKEGSADMFTMSEDSSKILIAGFYDGRLQELYEGEEDGENIRQISHFNDAVLEGKYVGRPESVTIQSCGYDIEGWIIRPKDYDPSKKYPAVLDIHGGPKTVYGSVFYHEMQVWAGMGYFVFFCNPKGGDGRDNEFMDIRGHYGETDYKNIMDFTDEVLKKYPQIDEKRVCVTGGSYGGFMTNWIIGHTDRFCCAASQRSISNWLSFHGVSDIGYYFAPDQCDADFFRNPEKMWQHSPVKYAADVKTPTLFIHSDQDYRCPLEQGLQMYSALMVRGIDTRLCMFHGENHELSRSGRPDHRERRLQEITKWFEKYSRDREA